MTHMDDMQPDLSGELGRTDEPMPGIFERDADIDSEIDDPTLDVTGVDGGADDDDDIVDEIDDDALIATV
jgi:hypothetical protein